MKAEKNQLKFAVAAEPPADGPPDTLTRNDVAGRKGFLYRRTVGAFSVVIPVSTRHDLLATEMRTLSILRHIELTIPIESRWWPVFRRLLEIHTGRVAGMGGDPTQIVPTGDGNWQHPGKNGGKGQGGGHDGDDHDHDCRDDDNDKPDHDHDHDRNHGQGHDAYANGHHDDMVTGKIVSLSYDHFGDFSGFVVETADDDHRGVVSNERRIEAFAREAWALRATVRVRLLPDRRVGSMTIAGQVDDAPYDV